MMKRSIAIAMVALLVTCAWAEEARLASVEAGQCATGDWETRAAFETAEYEWQATVRIEGPGTLTLCYPGDGRMALKTVEGPTEGPQKITLHMRANPDAGGGPWKLPVQWRFEASDEPATCWLTPAAGAPMPDDFAMEPEPLYQHRIPRVSEPPVIDGDLSDACWDEAAYIGDPHWRMYNEPRDAKMATWVWCAYDDENLYAAFRCETPDVDELVADIGSRDGYAWRDDSAEIFFDIGHDHDTYYEYIVTPRGVVFDSKWFDEGGQWMTDWDYIGEWETATEPGAWVVEIRLALKSYEKRGIRGNPTGNMPLPTGDIAGILFSRNDRVVGEGMSHADCAPSFHEVHQYGHLVGFRPNRVEAYRKTALAELKGLQRRATRLRAEAPQIQSELPTDPLAALQTRIEAPSPAFDEWVAIGRDIKAIGADIDRVRALAAGVIAEKRSDGAGWGLAVADPTEPAVAASDSETMRAPDTLELSGARGEVVPVQLAVLPFEQGGEVEVQPTGLSGGGELLDRIEWYRLEQSGRLVPRAPLTLEATGHIWWEITIPPDAEPGLYQGQIVTTDGEHRVALPVELTVHDFALPKMPKLMVSVGFDGRHVMERWYGERSPLGAGEYWPFAEALLEHGVIPREMLADFTWWGDEETDFGGATRMLKRAWDYAPDLNAMIAARPENLEALSEPRDALYDAVDHWEDVTDIYPIRTYLPAGAAVPEIGGKQLKHSVAVAGPDGDLEQIARIGTWAMAPQVATGFGGCEGARVAAAAGAAEVQRAWRIGTMPDPMHTRMLGLLADNYGHQRLFWDVPDEGDLCASGLLWCVSEDGEPLIEPHPTVTLKLLREACEDYMYLQILRGVNRESGPFDMPDRLWRLRLAQATQYRRNWDMVMNVRDFNRDPEHLAERREEIAQQIVRGREWLRRRGVEGSLPGDAERNAGR